MGRGIERATRQFTTLFGLAIPGRHVSRPDGVGRWVTPLLHEAAMQALGRQAPTPACDAAAPDGADAVEEWAEPLGYGTGPSRLFDVSVAVVGLLVTSPVLVVGALLVKVDSPGPVLHRGERVGLGGRHFYVLKLRTMIVNELPQPQREITVARDPRVTRVGRLLRRTKADELPQLVNVLRGDMSLVGPRPEAPEYVARYTSSQRRLLGVRPGLTSPASLVFRHEEDLLDTAAPDELYQTQILPAKLRAELHYMRHRSTMTDVAVIVKTAGLIVYDLMRAGSRRSLDSSAALLEAQAASAAGDRDVKAASSPGSV